MVDDTGQLYTIEGIAAGILMIITAYLVLSSTTVFTPQDTHITDMQLEQLGHDALSMMDIPVAEGDQSLLTNYIFNTNRGGFDTTFLNYTNARTTGSPDTLKYNATVYYRDSSGSSNFYYFNGSQYYRENAVKVTRWVTIPFKPSGLDPVTAANMRNEPQVVLVEVLLWRG